MCLYSLNDWLEGKEMKDVQSRDQWDTLNPREEPREVAKDPREEKNTVLRDGTDVFNE